MATILLELSSTVRGFWAQSCSRCITGAFILDGGQYAMTLRGLAGAEHRW